MRRIDSIEDIEAGLVVLAEGDRQLARAIRLAGPVPLRRKPPGFAALTEIILSQMVSKASAAALWRKLEAAVDGEITPQSVRALSDAAARSAGLSRAKAATLARVSEAVISGRLDLDHLCAIDAGEAVATMTAIKGVGPWTAQVYLLFCAGHPDVFPAGDVALQSAAAHVFELDDRPPSRVLSGMAESWSPWRGVAARLLWAYYAQVMRRDATPIDA